MAEIDENARNRTVDEIVEEIYRALSKPGGFRLRPPQIKKRPCFCRPSREVVAVYVQAKKIRRRIEDYLVPDGLIMFSQYESIFPIDGVDYVRLDRILKGQEQDSGQCFDCIMRDALKDGFWGNKTHI
jgi:hypothetical protein